MARDPVFPAVSDPSNPWGQAELSGHGVSQSQGSSCTKVLAAEVTSWDGGKGIQRPRGIATAANLGSQSSKEVLACHHLALIEYGSFLMHIYISWYIYVQLCTYFYLLIYSNTQYILIKTLKRQNPSWLHLVVSWRITMSGKSTYIIYVYIYIYIYYLFMQIVGIPNIPAAITATEVPGMFRQRQRWVWGSVGTGWTLLSRLIQDTSGYRHLSSIPVSYIMVYDLWVLVGDRLWSFFPCLSTSTETPLRFCKQ